MIDRDGFIELSPYSRPVDHKKLRFLYDEMLAHAGRQGREVSDLRVLDLGSAAGALTFSIAALAGQVDAVDIDIEALDKLRSRLAAEGITNVGVFESDGTTFGDPDQPYDVVVASEVIENVPDMAAFMDNVAKVMRPDGLLLATVPNGYGPFELRNRHLNLRARIGRSNRLRRLMRKPPYVSGTGPDAAHFLRYHELIELFRRAGFAPRTTQNSDFLAPFFFLAERQRPGTIDCRVADRLPRKFVSGWYIALLRA